MNRSSFLLLVLGLLVAGGCDPIYMARIDVDLRRSGADISPPGGVAASDAADGIAIVGSVARQFKFEAQRISEESRAHGWSDSFARNYAVDPEHRLYDRVTISILWQQTERVLRVALSEVIASRESAFLHRVRTALEDRLVARFGKGAVRYYRGAG